MKTEDQIQKAHDLIILVLDDRPRLDLTDQQRSDMMRIQTALCWVLGHHDGQQVQELIDLLRAELYPRNITLERKSGVGLEGN